MYAILTILKLVEEFIGGPWSPLDKKLCAACEGWERVDGEELCPYASPYVVVDLKVLVSSVYDDDPEHIKISFGESFFSSWRK